MVCVPAVVDLLPRGRSSILDSPVACRASLSLEAGQLGGDGPGTQSYAGISLSQGDEPLQTHPGLPGHFSLCSLGLRALPGSEEVQRVDSHVPGEEHIEVAEPEQLAAVAGHGSLEESEDRS